MSAANQEQTESTVKSESSQERERGLLNNTAHYCLACFLQEGIMKQNIMEAAVETKY